MLVLALLAAATVPAAERAAIFKSAGFSWNGGVWKSSNCKGLESDSYEPGGVDSYGDLNGDGRAEAVVTEGGALCYGDTGTHFWLMSKQVNGAWKLIHQETAVPEFLATKGVGGWPDLSLGAPGFCFAVMRWNGKAYAQNRFEYEGKRCRP